MMTASNSDSTSRTHPARLCVHYMAAELGAKRICVDALSPGPLKTQAGSGPDRFDDLLEKARQQAPGHQLVDITDVGQLAAFLSAMPPAHSPAASNTSMPAITSWPEPMSASG